MRRVLFWVGVALWAITATMILTRCTPSQTEEARYTTSLLRCVDKSETLAESKACRERVGSDFGITVTVRKDAGR